MDDKNAALAAVPLVNGVEDEGLRLLTMTVFLEAGIIRYGSVFATLFQTFQ